MDLEKFLEENVPHSHSRMANYWNEIKILRKKGFTLKQIRKFLALNGVTVSVTTISGYIQRREAKEKAVSQDTPPPAATPAGPPKETEPAPPKKEKTGNPVIDNYVKPEPKRFVHNPSMSDEEFNELFK